MFTFTEYQLLVVYC